MRAQQVAEHLWAATEQAKRLEDSSVKYDILETLTKARADLSVFCDEIIATLDKLSEGLDKL